MAASKSVDPNARQLERRYCPLSTTALGERDEVDGVKCARGAGVRVVVDCVRNEKHDRNACFALVKRPTGELCS